MIFNVLLMLIKRKMQKLSGFANMLTDSLMYKYQNRIWFKMCAKHCRKIFCKIRKYFRGRLFSYGVSLRATVHSKPTYINNKSSAMVVNGGESTAFDIR